MTDQTKPVQVTQDSDFRQAMVEVAREHGAGAAFIGRGESNFWLDIAYAAYARLASTPADAQVGEGWRYAINYGPGGETNYANVYDERGDLVGNLKIHHAIAITATLRTAADPEPAGAQEVETDERGEAMVCTGCGTTKTLAAIRSHSPVVRSCCPERKMVSVRAALAALPQPPAAEVK